MDIRKQAKKPQSSTTAISHAEIRTLIEDVGTDFAVQYTSHSPFHTLHATVVESLGTKLSTFGLTPTHQASGAEAEAEAVDEVVVVAVDVVEGLTPVQAGARLVGTEPGNADRPSKTNGGLKNHIKDKNTAQGLIIGTTLSIWQTLVTGMRTMVTDNCNKTNPRHLSSKAESLEGSEARPHSLWITSQKKRLSILGRHITSSIADLYSGATQELLKKPYKLPQVSHG